MNFPAPTIRYLSTGDGVAGPVRSLQGIVSDLGASEGKCIPAAALPCHAAASSCTRLSSICPTMATERVSVRAGGRERESKERESRKEGREREREKERERAEGGREGGREAGRESRRGREREREGEEAGPPLRGQSRGKTASLALPRGSRTARIPAKSTRIPAKSTRIPAKSIWGQGQRGAHRIRESTGSPQILAEVGILGAFPECVWEIRVDLDLAEELLAELVGEEGPAVPEGVEARGVEHAVAPRRSEQRLLVSARASARVRTCECKSTHARPSLHVR
eukprot:3801247-Rhodomonas_salina.1